MSPNNYLLVLVVVLMQYCLFQLLHKNLNYLILNKNHLDIQNWYQTKSCFISFISKCLIIIIFCASAETNNDLSELLKFGFVTENLPLKESLDTQN